MKLGPQITLPSEREASLKSEKEQSDIVNSSEDEQDGQQLGEEEESSDEQELTAMQKLAMAENALYGNE